MKFDKIDLGQLANSVYSYFLCNASKESRFISPVTGTPFVEIRSSPSKNVTLRENVVVVVVDAYTGPATFLSSFILEKFS